MVAGEDRYSKQVLFSPIGKEGQAKIRAARVLLVGCGGLGSVSADILARAGVGMLRIADRDIVELSNLQRQPMYDERDVRDRLPKAVAAARRISEINGDVKVEPVVADVGPENIIDLMRDVDVVVDGLDNFEGRYLINDACVSRGVPWAYGGCVGSYGLAAFIEPGKSACLRCLFPEPPEMGASPTCDTAGIISPALHVVASMQVSAVLRRIVEGPLPAKACGLFSVDLWDGKLETLHVDYNPEKNCCPCCVERKFDFLNAPGAHATSLCGRKSVQICPSGDARPDFASIEERLRPLGEIRMNDYLLQFKMDLYELMLFRDGRAIVKGTTDASAARSLVARYFGV